MKRALAEASLIMKPEGGANELLPSLKPIDGSGDFTFSRGADLAATRVNSDGLIEKYRENLLLQSNQFDTTWISASYTLTSGQSGYDGSNNAWLIDNSFAGAAVYQAITQGGVNTFSVYVRAGSVSYARLRADQNSDAIISVDLTNGSVSYSQGVIDSNVESVGNGWYRCSITWLGDVPKNVQVNPSNNSGGSVLGSIYIQNAQLERGLVATDYLDSGASTANAGIKDDQPRINYDANGENGSLLLEPSRTNLIEYSEYLGGWQVPASYTNTTTTDKQGFEIKSIYDRVFYKTTTINSGSTYSLSFYAKKDTWDFINIQTSGWDSSANGYTWFNLATGNVGTSSSNHGTPTMTPEGDGWYRCTIYFSSTTDLTGNIVITPVESNGSYTRGVNDQEAAFLTMVQWEQGSYPTSYIPNHGTSGGVTRAADDPSQLDVTGLTSTYNTLYAEFEVSNIDSSTQGKIALSDNSQNNRMTIYQSGDDLMLLLTAGGSAQTIITSSNILAVGTNYKVVAKHQNGSHALFINGTKIGEENSTSPTGLTKLRYGNELSSNGTQKFLGDVKQTIVFNEALTDAECITLTTL